MGQWKNSTISNPEWNKRALSWPVYEDGTWNSVRLQFYSDKARKESLKTIELDCFFTFLSHRSDMKFSSILLGYFSKL